MQAIWVGCSHMVLALGSYSSQAVTGSIPSTDHIGCYVKPGDAMPKDAKLQDAKPQDFITESKTDRHTRKKLHLSITNQAVIAPHNARSNYC